MNASRTRTAANRPGVAARSPIRIPKAAEIVSQQLRNQIIRGEIKEGDSLAAEGELMERFGVSRPTLREAIRVLESEGLISISRGARGGAIVHAPDVDVATRHVGLIMQANGTTLSDIYRVHMLIEPAVARMVASKSSKSAARILQQCIEEGRAHLDDDFGFGMAAARFRNTLIELAGIPTLTLMMSMLNSIFERAWGQITATAGREIDNSRAKHRGLRSQEKLIELIANGDGAGAEAHWRKHVEFVEKAMSAWLPAAEAIDILDN